MARGDHRNGWPTVAVEITGGRLLGARRDSRGSAAQQTTSRALPPGIVLPSLTAPNVSDTPLLARELRDVFTLLGGRSRDVILVLPDAAVRVVLLDFDTLPERRSEAEALVRLRLRKALPFDVDKAAVSYHAQPARGGGINVVAAVALASIVQEYEAAVRDAGYIPGVAVPAMQATLGLVDGTRPTLVVKVDAASTAMAIVNDDQLLLYRVLEHAGTRLSGEQLAKDVYPSLVFFQDNFGVDIERVLLAGTGAAAELAPALESQTGARVEQLSVPGASHEEATELAPVVGALFA